MPYFNDGNYFNIYRCFNCNKNCKTCKNNADYCTSCDEGKYLLIPNNICINECDTNIFVSNSTRHCGLCRDMDNSKPFKIIGSTECLSDETEGTEIYNSKFGLFASIPSESEPDK